MRTLKIYVTDSVGEKAELTIDDNGDQVDIRRENQCKLEADSSAVVDISHRHCANCAGTRLLSGMIGLSEPQERAFRAWVDERCTLAEPEIVEILEKIAESMAEPVTICNPSHERLVLSVESYDG